MSDPGPVTAAILRGRAALRQELFEDGVATWPQNPDWPGTRVGATALAVLALRAAGLPKDDAAVQRALRTTLLVYPKEGEPSMRDDLDGYTYALSLLAMALESVDRTGVRLVKEAICRQLCEGQLPNGQWTYNCRREGYGERPATGDNSNTQFAILGLRSLRRCGVPTEPGVIERTRDFWLSALNPYGGWGYGPKGSFHHEMSMTAAGITPQDRKSAASPTCMAKTAGWTQSTRSMSASAPSPRRTSSRESAPYSRMASWQAAIASRNTGWLESSRLPIATH